MSIDYKYALGGYERIHPEYSVTHGAICISSPQNFLTTIESISM